MKLERLFFLFIFKNSSTLLYIFLVILLYYVINSVDNNLLGYYLFSNYNWLLVRLSKFYFKFYFLIISWNDLMYIFGLKLSIFFNIIVIDL
jgi:hypothetical protein